MKNKVCIVRPPLAHVLRLSRLAGIAPLEFEPVRNGYKISVSRKWVIYGYILITLLNVINLMGLVVDFERRSIKTISLTSITLFIPDIITAVLTTGLGVYNSVRRMENLIKHLTLFDKVKADMAGDNGKNKSNNTIKFIIGNMYLLIVITYFITQVYFNKIDYPTETFIVAAYGIFYIEYVIVVILQLQIIFLVLETLSVLKLMSDKLNAMFSFDKSETELVEKEMHHIACAYVAVCEVISDMNNMDGGIVAIMFANFISSIVTTGYYGDTFFTVFPANFIFIQFFWCCLYTIRVLVFIETLHLIYRGVDVVKVMTSKLNLKITELGQRCPFNVEILFKQLLLTKPAYTPMGFFTLNRSLITTIISAVVTCLLLMIQFKWPGKYRQNINN